MQEMGGVRNLGTEKSAKNTDIGRKKTLDLQGFINLLL